MNEDALRQLVADGDLKSYRYVTNPEPPDWDVLLVLEFPSGRILHVSGYSLDSYGGLNARIP
jgi:hypothetical protein